MRIKLRFLTINRNYMLSLQTKNIFLNGFNNLKLYNMCTPSDIDNYRLTSMEEPSEEILAQLMHEAAVEASETNARVTASFFNELRQAAAAIR